MAFTLNRRARDLRDAQPAIRSQNARQVLAAADMARDNRKWADATRLYRQYLTLAAEDAPIWVQLGHALKESGNLSEAEAAYKKSLSLAPEVADTHLQLGHLYKRMRNFSNAIAAYREAARVDVMLVDARLELAEFGVDAEELPPAQRAAAAPRQSMTWIDLSDLFFYPGDDRTVSDLQRLELGIATAITAMAPEERAAIGFISEAADSSGYIVIDDVCAGELANELSCDRPESARRAEIARFATSNGRRYQPSVGDVLLTLGELWVSESVIERFIELGRQGVRIGPLIHDVTPITHPEFCPSDLAESFRSALSSLLRVADFIFCLSDHAARAIEDFAVENQITPPPLRTLEPAHGIADNEAHGASLSLAVERLIREPYALYVSPLAAGSNHLYLLRIWKRLCDRLGSETPKLVLVGEPGWRGDELLAQLHSTNNMNGRVALLGDVSAAERLALFRSARFTVFPSIEDGWAGPIAESIACGRPCVAANSGSIPEMAGDLVDYADPFNDNDGYEKIARLIEDQAYLEHRARTIQENFKPRKWRDVAADAINILRSLRDDWGSAEKTVAPPRATPGRIYRMGHREDVAEFIRIGDSAFVQFACDTSWDAVESFGRWLRGRTGRIAFATEQPESEPVVVMIETFSVVWLDSMRLRVAVNGANYPPVALEAGARRFLLLHATSKDGRVTLDFEAVGEIAAGLDPRDYLWFGVGSIGYAPGNDALARVMLLEEVMVGMSTLITIRPTAAAYRADPRALPRHEYDAEESAEI